MKLKSALALTVLAGGVAAAALTSESTTALFTFAKPSPASSHTSANMSVDFGELSSNTSVFQNSGTIDLTNIAPGDSQSKPLP